MLTLRNYATQLEHPEAANTDQAPDIDKVIATVREHTGIDVSGAEIAELPGNTVGLYQIGSGEIQVDDAIIEDKRILTHVLIHEATHAEHHANRKGQARIHSTELEEVLTELATAQHTGNMIAYRQYLPIADTVAANTNTTRAELIKLYKQGESTTLNELHAEAYQDAA